MGAARRRGARAYQEDHWAAAPELLPGVGLLAVFDGHGGREVSAHAALHAPEVLRARLRSGAAGGGMSGMPALLGDAFLELDERARRTLGPAAQHVGTTACAVLVGERGVWAANAGDSRAVIVDRRGRGVPLTRDHKPEREDERARIVRGGGRVVWDGACYRVNGQLNVSRGLGDWALRPHVVPAPEVAYASFAPDDAYVVVGSDGLWDVLTPQAVADVVLAAARRGQAGAPQAARVLADEALRLGSTDNVTAVVAKLGGGGGHT